MIKNKLSKVEKASPPQTLQTHITEIRKRLMWISGVLIIGMGIGWQYHQKIINILVRPLEHETLIYTSPTGGFEFIMKICFFLGVLVATPVIIYHILRFIQPVTSVKRLSSVVLYMVFSVLLLALGVSFAWLISLPSALYFLDNVGDQHIQALLSTNEYMSFVMIYLAGFGLLFQIPLLLVFINNNITPLKPNKLFKAQKYIIIGSFIVAAILTPTPDPMNQVLMALPIILLYQVGVGLIWLFNLRRSKPQQTVTEATPPSQTAPNLPQPALRPRNVSGPMHVPAPTTIDLSSFSDGKSYDAAHYSQTKSSFSSHTLDLRRLQT